MFGLFRRKTAVSRLVITPPEPRPGRSGLAIAATIHNEGRHLGEWLDFHRAMGVAAFYLYDDASDDGTAEIVAARTATHAVTVTSWRQRVRDDTGTRINNQVLAYAHAISNFGPHHRWMAFIDVDEFLVPTRDDTLTAALVRLEGEVNISLPWHMFGRNGHARPPEGGVLVNYTHRARRPLEEGANGVVNFKSLVDPCRVTRVKVHGMETDGTRETANDAGVRSDMRRRFRPDFYANAAIQLNHYYTRSDEELRTKIAGPSVGYGPRGSPEAQREKVMPRVAHIEGDTVEDRRAADLWQRIRGGRELERVKGIEPSS